MRKQCKCGTWIALSADGVAFDSLNPSHIGAIHEHQYDIADDMSIEVRTSVKKQAVANGFAKMGRRLANRMSAVCTTIEGETWSTRRTKTR